MRSDYEEAVAAFRRFEVCRDPRAVDFGRTARDLEEAIVNLLERSKTNPAPREERWNADQ
jgi:hypothetical protein